MKIFYVLYSLKMMLKKKFLRPFFFSIKNFIKDKCFDVASTLSYYSILSIVPILAFSFIIAEKMGLEKILEKGIKFRFQEHGQFVDQILIFVDNLIKKTKMGILASLGTFFLFISVMWLLVKLENFFKHLYKEKGRKWFFKIAVYIFLLFVAFSFFMLSGVLKVLIVKSIFKNIYFLQFISYLLILLAFSFLYFFLPKTKIKLSYALFSGAIAAFIYEIVQWIYFYFQAQTTRFGGIYGSFAAIPFFLIWLKISWTIFLFGAQFSYCLQFLKKIKISD